MLPIAIYNTDTIAPPLAREHGQYPDMFIRSLGARAPEQSFVRFDVNRGQYPASLDDFAGVIITGSQSAAYDGDVWISQLKRHIIELAARQIRVVGICFGHQVIHQALGGSVHQSPRGWCVGVHHNRLSDRAQQLGFAAKEVRLLSSHQDQVCTLAPGAQCLASTADCPVAMSFIAPGILTFQGHPEFTRAYARALMAGRLNIIGEAKYRRALGSLAGPLNDQLVLSWMLRFIGGELPLAL